MRIEYASGRNVDSDRILISKFGEAQALIILFRVSLSEPRIHKVQEAVLYILVCMFVG